MSTAPPKPLPEAPAKKSGCSGFAILLGCGGVLLVLVLLCGGIGFFGYRWGAAKVDTFAKKFEAQGYVRQTAQMIDVSKSPTEKSVYVCQSLIVTTDIDTDIAIAAQMAEIKGNVHGDIDFLGQMLTIPKGVVIDGDIRVDWAQMVQIEGEVKGTVSGNYSQLNYTGKVAPSDEPSTNPPPAATDETAPAKAPTAEKSSDESVTPPAEKSKTDSAKPPTESDAVPK